MRMRHRSPVLVAVLAIVSVVLPMGVGSAQTGTTYDLSVGADFFEGVGEGPRIPGFSLRVYPGSVTVHKDDVLHFTGFGAPILLDEGTHPREFDEENRAMPGDKYFDLQPDPDDGQDAFKFSEGLEGADCSSPTAPCEWNGAAGEILAPQGEEAFVKITANAGSVIWGAVAEDAYLRIEVVANNVTASTQSELDARAAQMRSNDYDTLAALHFKFLTKRSSRVTESGKRVWDAWAGIDQGPLGLDAMYPKRMRIGKGDTVRWHFNLEFNIHTVTMPPSYAFGVYESYAPGASEYGDECDPDGDQGTAPDTEPTFSDEGPPACPEGSTLEFDVNPGEYTPTGDGVYRGAGDVEHSGVRISEYQQSPGLFRDESPYDVKFPKASSDKGYKYLCLIHGPFMSGRVIVGR